MSADVGGGGTRPGRPLGAYAFDVGDVVVAQRASHGLVVGGRYQVAKVASDRAGRLWYTLVRVGKGDVVRRVPAVGARWRGRYLLKLAAPR